MKKLLWLLLLLPSLCLAQSGPPGPSGSTTYFPPTTTAGQCGQSTANPMVGVWGACGGAGSLPTCVSGQMIYYAANGSAASCLSVGTNLSITTGTLNASGGGGGGTVTSMSVVTANGFSGTVATPTTTPAITLNLTLTGDCSFSAGAITCTKTSGTAFSSLATLTPGTGVATALGIAVGSAGAPVLFNGAGGTPSSITLTNGTGLPPAGLTNDVTTINTTACTLGGSCTITASAGSITPGTTTVSGATAPCLIDNSTSTTMGCAAIGGGLALNSGTLGTNAPTRTVTTSPTIGSGDMGGVIWMNVTGGGTLTVPAISTSVFAAGMTTVVTNYSASTAAVSTTPTINSGGGCVSGTGIPSGASWQFVSNGTTLDCIQSVPTASGSTGLSGMTAGQVPIAATATTVTSSKVLAGSGSGITTGPTSPTSGDVVTMSGSGGQVQDSGTLLTALTQTIASGTAAMGTSAISSGSCATVVTVSASGVATTDTIYTGFNSDPTAVTGYGASATGAVLTIYPYPTANNVNFKVCNSTASSITPGSLTLNWRVTR